jgi:hypothetical protein
MLLVTHVALRDTTADDTLTEALSTGLASRVVVTGRNERLGGETLREPQRRDLVGGAEPTRDRAAMAGETGGGGPVAMTVPLVTPNLSDHFPIVRPPDLRRHPSPIIELWDTEILDLRVIYVLRRRALFPEAGTGKPLRPMGSFHQSPRRTESGSHIRTKQVPRSSLQGCMNALRPREKRP